jgi:hypothetical protein
MINISVHISRTSINTLFYPQSQLSLIYFVKFPLSYQAASTFSELQTQGEGDQDQKSGQIHDGHEIQGKIVPKP